MNDTKLTPKQQELLEAIKQGRAAVENTGWPDYRFICMGKTVAAPAWRAIKPYLKRVAGLHSKQIIYVHKDDPRPAYQSKP